MILLPHILNAIVEMRLKFSKNLISRLCKGLIKMIEGIIFMILVHSALFVFAGLTVIFLHFYEGSTSITRGVVGTIISLIIFIACYTILYF